MEDAKEMLMRQLLLLVVVMVCPLILQAQDVQYLENLYDFIENTAVFELNQEEGRAAFIPEKHVSLWEVEV